jgi:hypothetical protein
MSNETVTYSLEAILTRIESKIDRIDERLTKLEIGQAELKAELKGDIAFFSLLRYKSYGF